MMDSGHVRNTQSTLSKKFEKQCISLVVIISIHHDARSSECQIIHHIFMRSVQLPVARHNSPHINRFVFLTPASGYYVILTGFQFQAGCKMVVTPTELEGTECQEVQTRSVAHPVPIQSNTRGASSGGNATGTSSSALTYIQYRRYELVELNLYSHCSPSSFTFLFTTGLHNGIQG